MLNRVADSWTLVKLAGSLTRRRRLAPKLDPRKV